MKEIQNKTITEIKEHVDRYFDNTHHTQRERDQYTIAKLCEKIIELEQIIQNRAK